MSLSLIKILVQEMIINEKRRFPIEDRIKEEIIDVLDQYVNKGYFIHFTDDYSLQRLNVKSKFDTPLGIYAYPLIDKFYSNGRITVPFAGDRDYIIILKPKGNFVNSSTYSKNDLIEDGQKLGFSEEEIEEAYKNAKYEETPMSALMYLLYKDHGKSKVNFSVQNSARVTKRLRDLNYIGMFDDEGVGIIHTSESVQAFFVGSDMCEIVDVVKNPNVEIKKHKERTFLTKREAFKNMSNQKLLQMIFDDNTNIKYITFENFDRLRKDNKITSNFEILKKLAIINFKLLNVENLLKRFLLFIDSYNEKFQLWYAEQIIINDYTIKVYVSSKVYNQLLNKYPKNKLWGWVNWV